MPQGAIKGFKQKKEKKEAPKKKLGQLVLFINK